MKKLLDWIDQQTGAATAVRSWLDRPMAGGASWRYVWPSTILFTFVIQAITGVVLWMYYSPSAQTAWESVYHIQHHVLYGWWLRAVHHYAGQVMLVLVGIYFLQMLLRGAYRAPRELLFWTVVLLGLMTLALNLTGDLLPWDQNSYWSTHVRVGFLRMLPFGGRLFQLAAGGAEFGHLTATRFLTLHAGVFSAIFAGLLALHGWLARRHGLEQALEWHNQPYWPRQALRNAIACLVVLGAIFLLSGSNGLSGDTIGIELGSPADPSQGYQAARPEWSFRGLFQFRSFFPRELEVAAIFVIPGCLVLLVLAMPWIGKRGIGHFFNVALVLFVLVGLAVLSWRSYRADDEDAHYKQGIQADRKIADDAGRLADELGGFPPGGALAILRTSPMALFQKHCATCHDYADDEGTIKRPEKPTAPDLYQFASRPWIKGLLDPRQIATPKYFGNTTFKKMMAYVKRDLQENLEEKDIASVCAALSAEAALPSQREADLEDAGKVLPEGRETIGNECGSCHTFHGKGFTTGPDLTGYGSREWLIGIISNAAHKRFYGKNNVMPVYAATPDPRMNKLSGEEISVLVDWLRGEWPVSEKK